MPDLTGRQTITCPDCGTPVRPDRERLCPKCGYLLTSLRAAAGPPTEFSPQRTPGEPGEATSVISRRPADPTGTVLDGAPLPGPGEVDCPRCRERNPRERVRCQRCGLELRAPRPVAPPPPPVPPPAPPRPSGSLLRTLLPIAVAIICAVALVGAALYLAGLGPKLGDDEPDGGTGAAPPGLVQVDPSTVRASASSTNPDGPFVVANTVDGDPRTTWQSDGGRLRSNVGVRLTYQFATPVQLSRITLVNGDGRSQQDFAKNERVKRLRLTSGAWSARWNLEDGADPQVLDVDPGPVTTLTMEVESTYPGTTFKDLAVSEVAFYVPS